MTIPLISDATLAKIVRALCVTKGLTDQERGLVLGFVAADQPASALDFARRDAMGPPVIEAIEEANEEAAIEYNRRAAAVAADRARCDRSPTHDPKARCHMPRNHDGQHAAYVDGHDTAFVWSNDDARCIEPSEEPDEPDHERPVIGAGGAT